MSVLLWKHLHWILLLILINKILSSQPSFPKILEYMQVKSGMWKISLI